MLFVRVRERARWEKKQKPLSHIKPASNFIIHIKNIILCLQQLANEETWIYDCGRQCQVLETSHQHPVIHPSACLDAC